jgi:hypothetical protein
MPIKLNPPAARGARPLGARVTGVGLFGLGCVFLSKPRQATRLFGIRSREPDLDYVRALGIRDIVLAAGLIQASRGGEASLRVTAGLASLIPIGDLALLARSRYRRGAVAPGLHVLSSLTLAAIAFAPTVTMRRKSIALRKRDTGVVPQGWVSP